MRLKAFFATFVAVGCLVGVLHAQTIMPDGGSGGGGSTSPGGSPTDVQFNNAGSFGGDSGLTYAGNGGQVAFTLGAFQPTTTAGLAAIPILATLHPLSGKPAFGIDAEWATVGSAGNIRGVRTHIGGGTFGVPGGYTGSGTNSVIEVGNDTLANGQFNPWDEGGNIGITAYSATAGSSANRDQIGGYFYVNGNPNAGINSRWGVGSFGRASANGFATGVGMMGVADGQVTASIGGMFAITVASDLNWLNNGMGEPAALVADNANYSTADIFIARAATVDVVKIKPSGGVSIGASVVGTDPLAGNVALSGAVIAGAWNGTPIANAYIANPSVTISGHSLALGGTLNLVAADVSLGSVTNDAQTKASIVPNTAPSAGKLLVGNAGGTAYAPQSVSADATLSSAGALTLASTAVTPGTYGDSTHVAQVTVDAKGRVTAASNVSLTGISKIGQQNIPFVIPGNFTMGNNGAFSTTLNLPFAYPHAYFYMPASGISSGSAAGWYYAVCSSTTAATIYNNTYTSGTPTIPGSPTAFVTTGPGAVTQVTTVLTSYQFTVPGNTIGANGAVRMNVAAAVGSSTGAVGSNTIQAVYGGAVFPNSGGASLAGTANVIRTLAASYGFINAGVTNSQTTAFSNGAGVFSTSNPVGLTYSAVDTTVDQTLGMQIQNVAVANNNFILESTTVELLPGV